MLTSASYLEPSIVTPLDTHNVRLSLRFRSLAVRSRFRSILGFHLLSRRFSLRFSRRNGRRWLGWVQLHGMLQ